MKGITKTILIILTFFGFIIMGVLLISKMGDVSKAQGAVTKTYKISYYGNGGKNSAGKSTVVENVTYNSNYTTRDSMYTKKGYVFAGWNEKKDGTGTDWTVRINKSLTWTYSKSIKLYAQWKKGTSLLSDPEFEKCTLHSINKEFGATRGNIGIVTAADLAQLQTLNCSSVQTGNNQYISYSVKDTTGIEKMVSLKSLSISNGTIKKLNLTKNVSLKTLYLRNLDNLKSLDLTKNINLTDLTLNHVGLTSTTLNLTKNTQLQNLLIDINYKITSLDLTKNTNLQKLTLYGLTNLKKLNLTKNTKLVDLGLNTLPITSLNLTKNVKLQKLGLVGLNNISTLDLSKNVELTVVSLDNLKNVKTVKVPTNLPQSNVVALDCPNVKFEALNYVRISYDTQAEGNGFLGDNLSGTLLACKKDYVQFNISSAVNSTIKNVKYSVDGKTWKAFNSKNITYSSGAAIIKIFGSQNHILFKVTDKAGNIQVTRAFKVCVNK